MIGTVGWGPGTYVDAPGFGGQAVRGRQAELHLIETLLADDRAGLRAVIVEGEPGIGKSTVLNAAISVAAASGWTVLAVRGSQSETDMSFAGLMDLLTPVVDEVIDGLAEPQRIALEVALVRRLPDGVAVGPREIGAGLLSALRRLSVEHRVLIAIDDLPWTDRATLDALRFALRRLDDVPLRLIATRRTPGSIEATPVDAPVQDVVPDDAADIIPLGPADSATIGQLLADRFALTLPGRILDSLVDQTRGNPFWALEIAANLALAPSLHNPVPIPDTLSTLVAQRLDRLPEPVREALLVVAALPQPPVALVTQALDPVVTDPAAAINSASEAGVVAESNGRLRPAHPLLGSAALAGLPPAARTQLHRRLAAVVTDPEQHARHLALAAGGEPDTDLATMIDAGAAAALSRGATHAAADLAELAVTFTPSDDIANLNRRHLEAAQRWHRIADMERARVHAEAVRGADTATDRRILPVLAEATYWTLGRPATQAILEPLVRDHTADVHLRAVAFTLAADYGDGHDTPRTTLVQQALELFDEVGAAADPTALSTALRYLAGVRIDAGDGYPSDLVDRIEAVEVGAPGLPSWQRISVVAGFWRKAVDDLDGSRAILTSAIADAESVGDDAVLPALFSQLALTECWAGRYDAAADAIERGAHHTGPGALAPLNARAADGLLRVLTGDIAAGKALIAARLATERDGIQPHTDIYYRQILGLAALLEGDDEEAVAQLSTAYELARADGIHEPGRRQRLEGDLGQALVSTGRLDEAAALADELHALGLAHGRPTLTGIALRVHGLVHAARGNLVDAVHSLEQAVAEHERSPLPLERGRSLLALGQVHRRCKAKKASQDALQAAVDCFETIGATPFAQLARAELERGLRTRSDTGLTAAEQKVADLVAQGLTNREVAARLFTSVRTVEGHLAAVYRNLGIRSRAQLINRLAEGAKQT